MPPIEYNFHLMDSNEFENLVVSVIRHDYKIPLGVFSPGPDGGRDGAARGVDIMKFIDGTRHYNQNVVVQVKHTANSSAKIDDTVRKNVFEKKEGDKVKKLVEDKELDVYYLVTNYTLPAKQEQQLVAFFKGKGAKQVVVIGKETLKLTISDNQELRSLVPIKYVIGDLSQLSTISSKRQNSALLKYHDEELLKPFVSTKAYEKIQKIVFDSKKNVIILDGPHSGKSTILRKLGSDATQRIAYYNACVCTDWDGFQKLRLTSEKQLFLIDDVFGCATVDKGRLDQWNYKCVQLRAATYSESSVVITSRKSVYESALSMASEDFKEFLDSAECIILDHDDEDIALDSKTKLKILHNCIEHGDLTQKDKDKLEEILKVGNLDQFLAERRYPSFLLAAKRMGRTRFCKDLSKQGVKELFGKYGMLEEGDAPSPPSKTFKVKVKNSKKMEKIVAASLLDLKEKARELLGINVMKVEDEEGYGINEDSFQTHDPKEPLVLVASQAKNTSPQRRSPRKQRLPGADLEICHTLKSATKENVPQGQTTINEDEGEKVMKSITENFLATRNTNDYTIKSFNRDVVVKDVKEGSLIITVECLSLKALRNLWTKYCTGELNEVAERCLITEEIKSQHGIRGVKLRTYIDEDDYTRCLDILLRKGEDSSGPLNDLSDIDETSLIWIAANVVQEKFKIPLLSVGNAKVNEPQLVSPGPVDTSYNLKGKKDSLKPQKVAVLVEHGTERCTSPSSKMEKKGFENLKEMVDLAARKGGTDVLILVTNNNLTSTQKEQLKGLPNSESGIPYVDTLDCEEILEIVNRSPDVLTGVHWICKVSQVAKRAADTRERKSSMPKFETEDMRKITKAKLSTSEEDSGGKTVTKVLSFPTGIPSKEGMRKRKLAKDTMQPKQEKASTSKAESSNEPAKKIARKKIPKTKKGPWQRSRAPWLVFPQKATRAQKCAGCKKKLKGSGASVTELWLRRREFDYRKGARLSETFKDDFRTYHLDRACIARRHDDFDDPKHIVAPGVEESNDIVLTEKQLNLAQEALGKKISAKK